MKRAIEIFVLVAVFVFLFLSIILMGKECFGAQDVLFEAQDVSESAAVSPHYQLGAGDVVVIELWGKENETFESEVDKEGFLNLKMRNIDKNGVERFDVFASFSVNGVKFSELKEIVSAEMTKYSNDIGTEIFVNVRLGRIRGISVSVIGEVNNPGQYNIKQTSTDILNMLTIANGITAHGTQRDLLVRRGGEVIRSIDLYRLLDKKTTDTISMNLRHRDTLVVPRKSREIELVGAVKNPGTYEIREGEPLYELLKLLGGTMDTADLTKIAVIRKSLTGMDSGFLVNLEKKPDFKLCDGDLIEVYIRPDLLSKRLVEVSGTGVRNPGWRLLSNHNNIKGNHLAALLETVEIAVNTDIGHAELWRNGERIIIDAKAALSHPANYENIPLRDMDRLVIPQIDYYVTIKGAVYNPSKLTYMVKQNGIESESLDYYIDHCGGYLPDADKKNIRILKPNGETIFYKKGWRKEAVKPAYIINIPMKKGGE